MSAQFKNIFKSLRIVLLGAPFMLGACHSDFGPFPMPSGYEHHTSVYKAPPGPEAVSKRIEYSRVPQPVDQAERTSGYPEEYNARRHGYSHHIPVQQGSGRDVTSSAPPIVQVAPINSTAWNEAANDLVARLVADFGQPTEGIYVPKAAAMSESAASFETALQAALAAKGVTVNSAPGISPYMLDYDASNLNVGDGSRMLLSITLRAGPEVVVEESGIYSLGHAETTSVSGEHMPPQEADNSPPTGAPMPITPSNSDDY